ncbi:MAG TPA: hypothetical protein VJ805_01850 [Nitrospiraceae bacterium]|nr:hypothetical protein [Nitrospiraceae bacterium]
MSRLRTQTVYRVFGIVACVGMTMIPASIPTGNGPPGGFSAWAAPSGEHQDGPVWVVDPAQPGPDAPPVGRSLFDYLVTERQGDRMVYQVPFPFTALLERIERELGTGERDSPLKRVLIPLNRSLQRHAAKPDYFAYPRAVVGVDTDPPMRAGAAGMLLKDRLFLGYQEKAGILEVISYNEAAGRFEFQVVRDYAPGKVPHVMYANRALCTACHQNQSPIFSRPQWDETNANRAVANALEDRHADFYRFPLRQGVDVPDAIDQATDRANAFSAVQLLWQEGCERTRSPHESIQCRADLLRFLLQSRLTGIPDVVQRTSGSRDRSASHILSHWSETWPHGLKIPNPDLPNRNPIDYEPAMATISMVRAVSAGRYGIGERAKIRSIFEPTILREPLAMWSLSPESYEVLDRAITGLSAFLGEVDIERLDAHLVRQAAGSGARMLRYQSPCEADVRHDGGSAERVTFRCLGTERLSRKDDDGFSMEGVLYLKGGTVTQGSIERLSSGRGGELMDLKIAGGTVTHRDGRYSGRIVVAQKERRLHARLADGVAITELALQFSSARDRRTTSRTAGLTGSAVMTIAEDYAAVHHAIDAMARETLAGESDVLARKPFRRTVVMAALFKQLGMPPLTWCCESAHNMPPVSVTGDQVLHDHDILFDDERLPPALKAFDRYCAQCHHEDLPFPPNFLHGSPGQIQEQIRDCAERILFRLEMWAMPPSARQEAPMPPVTALQRVHLSPEQWAGHADLGLLKSYTADLLASQTGTQMRLADLAAKGYDNLQPCSSPPGSSHGGSEGRRATS